VPPNLKNLPTEGPPSENPQKEKNAKGNTLKVPRTPFAVVADDLGTPRIVKYAEYGMNRPQTYIPETVRETPAEVLLRSPEETTDIITTLRNILADDPGIDAIRERYLRASEYPLVEANGELCIPLYRGLSEGWEEATLASGLTTRGSAPKTKRLNQRETLASIAAYSGGNMEGEVLLKKLLESHIVNSSTSFLVPATTSIEYAKKVHPRTTQVIEVMVPIKHTVPVTYLRQRWNWGHPGFDNEQEVAIAGKIDPEWVRIVETQNSRENEKIH
jgi:hypothetical protein